MMYNIEKVGYSQLMDDLIGEVVADHKPDEISRELLRQHVAEAVVESRIRAMKAVVAVDKYLQGKWKAAAETLVSIMEQGDKNDAVRLKAALAILENKDRVRTSWEGGSDDGKEWDDDPHFMESLLSELTRYSGQIQRDGTARADEATAPPQMARGPVGLLPGTPPLPRYR